MPPEDMTYEDMAVMIDEMLRRDRREARRGGSPMPGGIDQTFLLPEDEDEWGTLDHQRDTYNGVQDYLDIISDDAFISAISGYPGAGWAPEAYESTPIYQTVNQPGRQQLDFWSQPDRAGTLEAFIWGEIAAGGSPLTIEASLRELAEKDQEELAQTNPEAAALVAQIPFYEDDRVEGGRRIDFEAVRQISQNAMNDYASDPTAMTTDEMGRPANIVGENLGPAEYYFRENGWATRPWQKYPETMFVPDYLYEQAQGEGGIQGYADRQNQQLLDDSGLSMEYLMDVREALNRDVTAWQDYQDSAAAGEQYMPPTQTRINLGNGQTFAVDTPAVYGDDIPEGAGGLADMPVPTTMGLPQLVDAFEGEQADWRQEGYQPQFDETGQPATLQDLLALRGLGESGTAAGAATQENFLDTGVVSDDDPQAAFKRGLYEQVGDYEQALGEGQQWQFEAAQPLSQSYIDDATAYYNDLQDQWAALGQQQIDNDVRAKWDNYYYGNAMNYRDQLHDAGYSPYRDEQEARRRAAAAMGIPSW